MVVVVVVVVVVVMAVVEAAAAVLEAAGALVGAAVQLKVSGTMGFLFFHQGRTFSSHYSYSGVF